eukprot:3351558-Pyramimonas_sp.AAC.1
MLKSSLIFIFRLTLTHTHSHYFTPTPASSLRLSHITSSPRLTRIHNRLHTDCADVSGETLA